MPRRHQEICAGEAAAPSVRGVDIEVRRDELLMLVGPSVCGRTTLIHAAGVVSSPFRSCRASRSLQGVLS
jgi:ABC-type lipoprotein export system ATPase subunit